MNAVTAKARKLGSTKLRPQIVLLSVAAVIVALWGVWVTNQLVSKNDSPIVQVQLQTLIGDYVKAQARSNAPEEQSAAATVAYVRAIEREIEVLSAEGKIVLVANAVAGGEVVDVTGLVRARAMGKLADAGAIHPPGADGAVRTAMRGYMADSAGAGQ